MTGRLTIVDTASGTDIHVKHGKHVYSRHFEHRESAVDCLISNGYVDADTGASELKSALSPVGTEVMTSADLLLRQGYVRED